MRNSPIACIQASISLSLSQKGWFRIVFLKGLVRIDRWRAFERHRLPPGYELIYRQIEHGRNDFRVALSARLVIYPPPKTMNLSNPRPSTCREFFHPLQFLSPWLFYPFPLPRILSLFALRMVAVLLLHFVVK